MTNSANQNTSIENAVNPETSKQADFAQPEQNSENILLITLIAVVATIGGFLFGFDSGVINGTVDGLKLAFGSGSLNTGFNVASMLLGCAIGAFAAGQAADHLGRKKVLLITAVFFIVSAWGSGIADTSATFVVYRILGGIAVGAASVLAPAYISEIAPTRIRGMLTAIQQVAIITGLFCSFLSNYLLAKHAGASTTELWFGYQAWRWMFWIELIPAFLFLITLTFIPESPRFLVMKNDHDTAKENLTKLYGQQIGEKTWQQIKQSLTHFNQPKLADVFQSGSNKIKPIVWIGIGLAVFQQLVGINVVFYYGAVLWQAVGFSESDALLINIISGGVSILACLITLAFIDKAGRKPFLLIGSVGMALSLAGLVIAFANGEVDAQGQLNLVEWGLMALIHANIYVFFFNLSWGPVMWIMLGEMFPNQIRGSGLALAGLAQWLANFIVTLSFPLLLTGLGLALTYSIYTLCAGLSVLFVLKLVKETKGIALEKMSDS